MLYMAPPASLVDGGSRDGLCCSLNQHVPEASSFACCHAMASHRLLARVAVVAGVDTMAHHVLARVAGGSSTVVAEVDGVDGVVILSTHY